MVSDVRERVQDLGSPLRFILRRSSLVECVSVLHGTCLQCTEKKFQPCLSKNPKYTFYTIKSLVTLTYYHTIAHTGCDNKGAKNIYRCKLKTVWWCDYGMLQLSIPCLKASREVWSTKGCGRLFHILMLSGKECLYVEVLFGLCDL